MLSKLFKGHLRAHLTFQKSIESPFHLFKNCERNPVFSSANRKKGNYKAVRGFRINSTNRKKRNQSADTIAGFENSNEIQNLDVEFET